jgi:hypothetical protein
VRDRVVQEALRRVIEPIFEPHFHPSSYAYRPERSCHMAVAKAEAFINRYGLKHVVDMDLSKCFDRLDHELMLQAVNRRISDGRVLALIPWAQLVAVTSPDFRDVSSSWQSTPVHLRTLPGSRTPQLLVTAGWAVPTRISAGHCLPNNSASSRLDSLLFFFAPSQPRSPFGWRGHSQWRERPLRFPLPAVASVHRRRVHHYYGLI